MKYLLLSFAVFFVSCFESQKNEKFVSTEKPILSEAESILEEIELIEKNAISLRQRFEIDNVQPDPSPVENLDIIKGQEKLLKSYVIEAKQAYRLVRDAISALNFAGEDAKKAKEAEERAIRGRDQLIEIKTRAQKALDIIKNSVK
ncbi:MAG: hypothetical protein OXC37_05520 [Bdellovibrionaceae bacterium]|nr:hypothetical protein [Pseudobdellovibrionaceae bacterium]